MLQKIHIQKTVKQLPFYFPITVYCSMFLVGYFFCLAWLKEQPKLPGTPFQDILVLLLKITLYLSFAFFIFGLLTVFVAWIYFVYANQTKQIKFRITTKEFDTPYQPIELLLHPVFKPLLGYIKLRFVYDNGDCSDKIQLVEKESLNLNNKTLDGFYDWKIENIKEFRISKVIVYFEDFLQFFSLAYKLSSSERFYTPPQTKTQQAIRAKSRNSEIKKERINEMRKVEGDLFNYKKFSSGDDVRRIVWKIYAKSKELVIRKPEEREPYASHLYLYVSFYSTFEYSFNMLKNQIVEGPLLNFYKNAVWNIYTTLSSQNADVRWVSDQPQKSVSFVANPSRTEDIKHLIALSDWQNDNDLLNFVNTKNAAMLVVSSLANIEQVKQLAEQNAGDIKFVFIPLSKCFGKQTLTDWLKWAFVQKENDEIAMNKATWATSLLRKYILKNEKLLEKYFRKIG